MPSSRQPSDSASLSWSDRIVLKFCPLRPGLGSEMAEAIAGVGINISFMVVQVVGRRYSAVYGFETEEEAQIATNLIKKVSKPRRR